MEPHAKYAVVGFLMVLLIAGIVGGTLWLVRPGAEEGMTLYTIYFKNQSLSGLQPDSIVTMRGLKIGSVKNVKIEPQDIERVRVTVRLQSGTPVKTDTRAVIQRNLLTGLAFIDLTGSTQDAALLDTVPVGESYPVIPEGQTTFEALQKTAPEVVDQIRLLLDRSNELLSDENRKSVSEALVNVNRLMAQSSDVFKEVTRLTESLRHSVESMDKRTQELAEGMSVAGKSITGEVRNVAREFEQLARSLSLAADKFQDPRSAILGPPPAAYGPGEMPSGKAGEQEKRP